MTDTESDPNTATQNGTDTSRDNSDQEPSSLKQTGGDSGYSDSNPPTRTTGDSNYTDTADGFKQTAAQSPSEQSGTNAAEQGPHSGSANAHSQSGQHNDSASQTTHPQQNAASPPLQGEARETRDTASSQGSVPSHIDWADRAREVQQSVNPREYTPPQPAVDLPWIYARSKPISSGLESLNARIRPELRSEIKRCIQDAEQQFPADTVHQQDLLEAALTVALWHQDQVFALLAQFGYGMTD